MGSPLRIVISANRSPYTFPQRPRISSSMSGFRFCGIIELLVVYRSAILTGFGCKDNVSAMVGRHSIRIPVHGFVELDDWEWDIVNHPVFQRLRRIRQLAFSEHIYPG